MTAQAYWNGVPTKAWFVVLAERPARAGWTTPSRPRDAKGTEGVARTLWEVAA